MGIKWDFTTIVGVALEILYVATIKFTLYVSTKCLLGVS